MWKHLYSRFLDADPSRLHFAAHSHHLWPDVTREAVLRCWDDAALHVDNKWKTLFEKVIPEARRHIAGTLALSSPHSLVFAPNTHELVVRLLSALPSERPVRVLTTDSEFRSFSRQAKRLEETGWLHCERMPTRPFATFRERFEHAARRGTFDMVFLSHVFFDSGYAVDELAGIVAAVRSGPQGDRTLIVVDGYHAFFAIPVSLAALEHEIFYLAGGYKYAQAGEGVCFMHVPPAVELRPVDTGWFAAFAALEESAQGKVSYGTGADAFWGATFDPTGLYRFNAVMSLFAECRLRVEEIHEHVRRLQRRFLGLLSKERPEILASLELVTPASGESFGHFLAFENSNAVEIHRQLELHNIRADRRGDVLRFGFGMYHDESDVDELFLRLARSQ